MIAYNGARVSIRHPWLRVLRRPTAGLLLAAGIIGAGIAIGAPSGYAVDNASLAVSPSQGSPGAQFTVMYRWQSTSVRGRKHPSGCAPGQITFEWDGSPLGSAAATLAGNSCVAVLRVAPPPGVYHGASVHTISVASDPSARATYTVVDGPGSTPSAGTSSATPDDTATYSAVDPQATAVAGVQTAPPDTASPTALADRGQDTGGGGIAGWLIAFGAVLFLTGAGTLGLSGWRARHPKPDAETPWSLANGDTQQFSLPDRAARRAAHRARRWFS
jgi:hypothetical protein